MEKEFNVNSSFLYFVTAMVIVFVIAQSVLFLLKASRQAKKIGITTSTIRKTIFSSALFTIAPAVAILIGVISLSGMLGLPFPWLRLSVLGAVTYELPAATATAKAMNISTGIQITDPKAFTAIAWVMTLGIIPGIILVLFALKKIENGFGKLASTDSKWGKLFMDAMFMGMISAFLGMLLSDVRLGLPGFIPLIIALISACVMMICGLLIKKHQMTWLENYALPISMLIAMAAAIPVTALMG